MFSEFLIEASLFQYFVRGKVKFLFLCRPLVGTFIFLFLLEFRGVLGYQNGLNLTKVLGKSRFFSDLFRFSGRL